MWRVFEEKNLKFVCVFFISVGIHFIGSKIEETYPSSNYNNSEAHNWFVWQGWGYCGESCNMELRNEVWLLTAVYIVYKYILFTFYHQLSLKGQSHEKAFKKVRPKRETYITTYITVLTIKNELSYSAWVQAIAQLINLFWAKC